MIMTKQLSLPARWTMWESFSTSIYGLAKKDREAAKEVLLQMMLYASYGEEPDFTEFGDKDGHLQAVFDAHRFNLDSSVQSCASGKRGGQKKAENARRKEQNEGKGNDMINKDEMKRVKKMARAMGGVYEATTIEDWHDDALLPDYVYEDQAAFMSDDYERRREIVQAECEAYELWG